MGSRKSISETPNGIADARVCVGLRSARLKGANTQGRSGAAQRIRTSSFRMDAQVPFCFVDADRR
jgi:hypothetical protein